jgi:hypothetical protein
MDRALSEAWVTTNQILIGVGLILVLAVGAQGSGVFRDCPFVS